MSQHSKRMCKWLYALTSPDTVFYYCGNCEHVTATVGNAVANRHKWRIGHESAATCQTKELSNFTLDFLIFSTEPISFIICV
jgi:hypothetical protein